MIPIGQQQISTLYAYINTECYIRKDKELEVSWPKQLVVTFSQSRDFPPISLLICETLSTSATLCLFGLVWGQPWSHVTSPHILTCPQWLWKEARWLTLKGLEVRSQAKWTQTENSQTAVKRYHSQWYQLANSRFLRYMHILTRSVISEKTKSWWWLSFSLEDFPPIPFAHMWDFVSMSTTGFVRVGERIVMESSDFTSLFSLLTVAQCKEARWLTL